MNNTFIFIAAFFIRLIGINQSLWLDEGVTARVIQEYDFFEIIPKFSIFDFHPPFYYFFMHIWGRIFGYSVFALRFPSLLFSILTGYVIYLTGKELQNKKIGFWACIFFLFNPLIVYYSQEARMYMMATFFISVAFYFFIKILKQKKLSFSSILFCNIFIFLSFITFYGAIFFIISLYLYLLIKRKFRIIFLSLPGFIITFVFTYPLLILQFSHAKTALLSVKNWNLVLGKTTIKNLLLIPIKFSLGKISFFPKKIYYIITSFWTLCVFIPFIKGGIKKPHLLYFFVFPLFLGLIFSYFSPLLQYFRFLYLILPMSILLSYGISKQWQKIGLTTGFILSCFIYLLFPSFYREDWKRLAQSLSKKTSIIMILPSSDALRYYNKDITIVDMRTLYLNRDKWEKNYTIIPYTSEIYGIDYRKIMQDKKYHYRETRYFRDLYWEYWSR